MSSADLQFRGRDFCCPARLSSKLAGSRRPYDPAGAPTTRYPAETIPRRHEKHPARSSPAMSCCLFSILLSLLTAVPLTSHFLLLCFSLLCFLLLYISLLDSVLLCFGTAVLPTDLVSRALAPSSVSAPYPHTGSMRSSRRRLFDLVRSEPLSVRLYIPTHTPGLDELTTRLVSIPPHNAWEGEELLCSQLFRMYTERVPLWPPCPIREERVDAAAGVAPRRPGEGQAREGANA